MSPSSLPALPEPDLHVHELLSNEGGVWLGCKDRDVVARAHDPGETGEEIIALYTADQMHAYARAALEAAASPPPAPSPSEREALRYRAMRAYYLKHHEQPSARVMHPQPSRPGVFDAFTSIGAGTEDEYDLAMQALVDGTRAIVTDESIKQARAERAAVPASPLAIAARNLIDRAYELESDAEVENLADQLTELERALEPVEDRAAVPASVVPAEILMIDPDPNCKWCHGTGIDGDVNPDGSVGDVDCTCRFRHLDP